MANWTYREVQDHVEQIEGNISNMFSSIDRALSAARKPPINLPVYVTKWRHKTASSAYLKTKKKGSKYKTLNAIKDYGGFRIVCLFQQDIIIVHRFIVQKLLSNSNHGFVLEEFKAFNWGDKDLGLFMSEIDEARSKMPNLFDETFKGGPGPKDSGYRSLHYVIRNSDGTHVELQLRTLLQDVWSELEHGLAYKQGNVNPHVRKSFSLLSRELKTNDMLISHLQEISRHENVTNEVRARISGPYSFFRYQYLDKSSVFADSEIAGMREQYYEILSENISNKDIEWVEHARDWLNKISKKVNSLEAKQDKYYAYWLEMEHAYLLFSEHELDGALKIYKSLIEKGTEGEGLVSHITYFRAGEVLLSTGETTESLVMFDEAEHLCDLKIKELPPRKSSPEFRDKYLLNIRLAHVYWRLGKDFYSVALTAIKTAEKTFNRAKSYFTKDGEISIEKNKLLNNIFWYSLECYIERRNTLGDDLDKSTIKLRDKLKELFEGLEENHENQPSNLDSCAWYCYHEYLLSENISWLVKAKKYADMMLYESLKSENIRGVPFLTGAIKRYHFETISSAYYRDISVTDNP